MVDNTLSNKGVSGVTADKGHDQVDCERRRGSGGVHQHHVCGGLSVVDDFGPLITTSFVFIIMVGVIFFKLLLPYCLHELVQLADLLVCDLASVSRWWIATTCTWHDVPLILSILLLSIFSPLHEFPSSCCAYICHSVRKPIWWGQREAVTFPLSNYRTMCMGFSTLLCARNSDLTYSSPKRRIWVSSFFLWARSMRR